VPLAALLELGLGDAGTAVAAIGAVVLTVGAVLAYMSGAAGLARALRGRPVQEPAVPSPDDPRGTLPAWLALAILASGAILIVPLATGAIDLATLVNVPTTFFLVVYLGCTAAGWRLLRGVPRACAAVAFAMVTVVLAFCGAALIPAALVIAVATVSRKRPSEPADRLTHHPSGTPLKAARSRS
jgi:amino acid efflux transporter